MPAVESTPSTAVAIVDRSPYRDHLTTKEVADQLKKSVAWVKRHAGDLGGRLIEGNYQFPSVEIERRRTTVERVTFAGTNKEPDLGRRAAAVFDRLELSQSTSQIVRDLEEAPDFVARMRAEWRRGYEQDREGLTFQCGCGAPSNPHTARCDACAARARVLTDAQLAILADAPVPAANACTCAGCGTSTPTHVATSICNRCAPRLGIVARNGALAVEVAGRIVRQYTLQETRALFASVLGPAPTAPAAEVPMAATEDGGPSAIAKGFEALLAAVAPGKE
jgi:hypothetical protein